MATHKNHEPAKALIVLRDTSRLIHGPRIDEHWIWVEQYGAHVWKGRPLTLEEFDTEWEHCWEFERVIYSFKPVILGCHWNNLKAARDVAFRNRGIAPAK